MRWPAAWSSPENLALLNDTPINCLLFESSVNTGPIAEELSRRGIVVVVGGTDWQDRTVCDGEWPGIQLGARGQDVSAGPTGVPWLNSNGWRVRAQHALYPDREVWVDAPAKGAGVFPYSFALAYLDAAAYGGRWMVSLDDATATAIAAKEARALEGWNRLAAAMRFFDARKAWADYQPQAVVGVVADFSSDEFLAGETLNLLARANQQYRAIPIGRNSDESWKGLRAILYVASNPPPAGLRRQIEALVANGMMLIAGPQWGTVAGPLAKDQEHSRYDIRVVGKGRVAIAKEELNDPYTLANDSVLLVSHRYELVRFFNPGAVESYLTTAPGGKSALLHMLFYADRGPQDASVWVAGRYRSAKLWTIGRAEPLPLPIIAARGGIELHLPEISRYAAAELEI